MLRLDAVVAFGFPPVGEFLDWLPLVLLLALLVTVVKVCESFNFPASAWRALDRALPVPSSTSASPAPAARDLQQQTRLSLVRPAGDRSDRAAAVGQTAAAPASPLAAALAGSLEVEAMSRHLHAACLRRLGIPASVSAGESFDRLSPHTREFYRTRAEFTLAMCDPDRHGAGLAAVAAVIPPTTFERALQTYERAVLTAPARRAL